MYLYSAHRAVIFAIAQLSCLLSKHDKSRDIIIECISRHAAPSGEWYWVQNSFYPTPYLTPHSGWTPCNINVTYTSLESAFNGQATIQSLTIRVYLHSFSCYCLRNTRNVAKCQHNTKRIWPYSSSRSSKAIDLGVNGKPICDFLLVINCNFIRICYRFRDIQA